MFNLFINKLRIVIIDNAEKPYIGQYGPFKNPLFIIFFEIVEQYIISIIQPRKEYIKNKINAWKKISIFLY